MFIWSGHVSGKRGKGECVPVRLPGARPFPGETAMRTEEPTPARPARKKLMITNGMARFTAVKAVELRKGAPGY